MGFMLLLRGTPAAFVGARRWYLVPHIAALPPDDPIDAASGRCVRC